MSQGLRHIAVIMDGNGRWARSQGLQRIFGHRKGTKATVDLVDNCVRMGLEFLTLFVFSSENWQRPAVEVGFLMDLLCDMVDEQIPNLQDKKVRLRIIGDLSKVPNKSRVKLLEAVEVTKSNDRMELVLAIGYGGRLEIVEAARALAAKAMSGELDPAAIDEKMFASHLYFPHIPDPDLVIRTGGEFRVSNYLLWQTAYSEFYITDVLWPDFSRADLDKAVAFYQGRQRRFGKVIDE